MMDQSSVRQITSSPSRICLCHDTSPDCLIVADPTPHNLYPGETLTVSVAVVGQAMYMHKWSILLILHTVTL